MKLDKDQLELFKLKPDDYSKDRYQGDLFEQYKLYVQMADKISERRSTANTFFLTANTLLISIFGVAVGKDAALANSSGMWFSLFGVSGLVFSFAWFSIIRSYRQLNSGKFQVIHKVEEKLPLALYKAEWMALGEGRDPSIYKPLTHIEKYVPLAFGIIYAIILFLSSIN